MKGLILIVSLVHYDNVISVAAINAMDSLWQYSNYGNEAATISAYGENMGGYSHTGETVSYSGTSISTYYVTRQLAAEIARNKTRSLEDIWTDFEANYLRDCMATNGLTSTGMCLDISLREVYNTLAVQPYNIAPFHYNGMERVPTAFSDYPPEVVDWILVSARTEIDASSTISSSRTAAWLLKDGTAF